jgi:hypothetical protein
MATSFVDNSVRADAMRDAAAARARTRLFVRAFGGFPGVAQVWFRAAVLDRYRGASGFVIQRTDTVGRIRCGSWRIDFGIAEGSLGMGDGAVIHASVGDLTERLPESERAHWASHAWLPNASINFLLMQATKGACIDDGDTRDW